MLNCSQTDTFLNLSMLDQWKFVLLKVKLYKPGVLWSLCWSAFRWWGWRWRRSRGTQPASPRLRKSLLPSGRPCNIRQDPLPTLQNMTLATLTHNTLCSTQPLTSTPFWITTLPHVLYALPTPTWDVFRSQAAWQVALAAWLSKPSRDTEWFACSIVSTMNDMGVACTPLHGNIHAKLQRHYIIYQEISRIINLMTSCVLCLLHTYYKITVLWLISLILL